MLIQACVNGSRHREDHPAVPITPAQIAADAAAVMRAGAGALHVHPRDARGEESMAAADVAAVCSAVREACPGLPISVSTGAWIEPSVEVRREFIVEWTVLPDCASVNLGEEGALELITQLNEIGVDVEAGVWTVEDARLFIDEGLDSAVARVLVEIEAAPDPDDAVALAAAIDTVLDDGLSQTPRIHHGEDESTWAVIDAALDRGHDVRIGLEDTLVDADGNPAMNNASLVTAVAQRAAAAGRAVETIPGA